MSKFERKNGSEISPCILSQIKFALGLKSKKPLNNKKCSNEYWNEVVEIIAEKHKISKEKYNSILKK
ncbi:hypothetical protein [Flavobacterium sp.]|uniref:hypothetical protein n=1 Tax=Flavobacterium sp. TaxID=239 RepID=UPI0026136BAB|nr:hypothetical protein [Flavobacterium sp.]